MSLFGYFIIARAGGPVGELSCVQRICRESIDGISPGTLCGTGHDSDWQYVQILNGWGLDAADVATETGAPAMVVYVIESAVGIVEAATPDGQSWRGCLNPADAVRVFDMPSEMVGSTAETTELAMTWAAATGRTPDADAVAAALDRYVGPFGEGVDALVSALGFRFE